MGDHEVNVRTPLATKMLVMQAQTCVLCLNREAYKAVFATALPFMIHQRIHQLVENFVIFKQKDWTDKRLQALSQVMKGRLMRENEVLFEDQTKAEYIYFLIRGTLRIEKDVII